VSAVSDDLTDLGRNPKALAAELDRIAAREPWLIKEWVQEHPKNLMAYMGANVEDFHAAALEDALALDSFLWLAPRGSGKSTSLCMYLPAWMAIADPDVYTKAGVEYLFPGAPNVIGPHNVRIAIISNEANKAVALQWQIKATLTSPKMALLFGNLQGSRWKDVASDTALRQTGGISARDHTFTSLGIGSKATGGHYDVVAPDDCVTEETARTELQRSRMKDYFNFTVSPTREPWARMIVAGTRYHPHDWYHEIKEWQLKGLFKKVRRTQALTEDGDKLVSYWPAVYSVEKLLEIKEQIGPIAFATQYQNETSTMLGEFFLHEWCERRQDFDSLPAPDRAKARTMLAIDPAIGGGPRRDRTAIVVLSYVAPYFYVRKVLRGAWTQLEIIQQTTNMNRDYKPFVIGVEVVQGQEWLCQELRRVPGMHVRELRPQQFKGKDKVGRADHVRTLFQQGRVFFPEPTSANGVGRLIEEMLAFPDSSDVPGMDDTVDAMVWALLLLVRPASRTYTLPNRRGF